MARLANRLPSEQLLAALAISVLCVMVGALAGVAPTLAIAASLGIVFVFVALWNLTAGVSAFAVVIFLEALLRGGGLVSSIKLIGALLVLAWLAQVATANRAEMNLFWRSHPKATYLMLAFVAWVALGAVWADDPSGALTDASRFLLLFALFAIIFTAARRRVDVGWLMAAYLAGITATALYGLVARPELSRNVDRVASAVGNPNELAAVMVAGLALATGVALALKRSPLRLPAAILAVLTLSTLVLTGSRGGTIAMVLSLLAAVVVAGRWRPQVMAIAALVLVSGVGFFFTLAPETIQDRLLTATPGELDASSEARGTIWRVGWAMATDNAVKGVGSDNYNENSPEYLFEVSGVRRSDQIIDENKTMHNMYLQAFAELGVIGLVMFLALLVFGLSTAWRAVQAFRRNGDERMEIICRALIVAMVGVMVAGFFSSHQFGKWFWFLFAFGPILLELARRESGGEEPAEVEDRMRATGVAHPRELPAPS